MGKIYIGNNKWFIDDGLDRRKNGGIKWSDSIGKTIEFQYFNYHGCYTIKKVIPVKDKWYKHEYVIYFNDDIQNEYIANKESLRGLHFGKMLNCSNRSRNTNRRFVSRTKNPSTDFLYNIGDIVNNQFFILERERKNMYSKTRKHLEKVYKCKCLLDGYIFESSEHNLNNQKKCAACLGKVIIRGVNDIATKRPEMVRFLKNKDDAYRYAGWAQTILDFKCDICGKEFTTSPHRFSYNFSCGCYSSDSYPNRLIREIFEQLKIPYIKELRKKHFSWCGNYRYDLYFEINDIGYIVEMDGHWHRNKQLKIDKIKDELALSHGIKTIRIDCDYPKVENRLLYIRDNLLKSDLSALIDLSKIDWNVVDAKLIDDNITKKICELRNKGFSYKDIMDSLDICKATVDVHIRIGKNNGILNEWASSNFYKKEVFEIINLENKEIRYCIGVHKFFKDAKAYIGRTLSANFFKKHSIDNYLILNGYEIRKISYYDYLLKTSQI